MKPTKASYMYIKNCLKAKPVEGSVFSKDYHCAHSVTLLLFWKLYKQMCIRLFKSPSLSLSLSFPLSLSLSQKNEKLPVVGSFHFVSTAAIFIGQKSMLTSLTFQFSLQSAVDMDDETLSYEV